MAVPMVSSAEGMAFGGFKRLVGSLRLFCVAGVGLNVVVCVAGAAFCAPDAAFAWQVQHLEGTEIACARRVREAFAPLNSHLHHSTDTAHLAPLHLHHSTCTTQVSQLNLHINFHNSIYTTQLAELNLHHPTHITRFTPSILHHSAHTTPLATLKLHHSTHTTHLTTQLTQLNSHH